MSKPDIQPAHVAEENVPMQLTDQNLTVVKRTTQDREDKKYYTKVENQNGFQFYVQTPDIPSEKFFTDSSKVWESMGQAYNLYPLYKIAT